MEPPRIMIRQLLELGIEIAEYGPAESLPLEDMAELREGRRVRHLFLHEVEVHEALHRPRVQDGILGALVGKAEHHLEQVHPEHRLRAAHMPAARLGMVAGPHQGAPPVPGHLILRPIRSRNSSRLVFRLCPCDSRSPKLIWLPMPASRSVLRDA